jgi:ribosomal protein L12E/L44/L45/RPP1/RPP2
MDLTSAGLDYDADSDILLDGNGAPLSQASYAQFVDAQGGSAAPHGDGDEEEEEDDEEDVEEEEESDSIFRKS